MAWSIFKEGGGDAVAVGWAMALLSAIGAPESAGNIQFVYQWEKAEGGGGKYNPLNQGPVPGHPELTTTGSQYGGGAADYASWDAGIQGAVDYLNMGNYSSIKTALRNNDPDQAKHALWSSPWAASHYGLGADWPNVPTPKVTPKNPGSGNINANIPNPLGGTTSALSNTLALLKKLADVNFWKRIAVGVLGAVLVGGGVYFLMTKEPGSFKPTKVLENIP